jgi:prepilin-type N-terminal cleavage/methylation domain-containing protein
MTKGFSFLELVIVLAILGILAVVAIPRILNMGEVRLDMALSKVAADLGYAREYAVNHNGRTRVTFSAGQDSYMVEEYDAVTLAWGVLENPTTREDFDIRLGQGPYSNVDITGASFNGQSRVEFNSIGEPFGGGAPLASTGTVTMRYEGSSAQSTISVTPVTGSINVTR